MRRIVIALAVLGVIAVSSALTWKRNALLRQIEQEADTSGRYCDMGVRLRVVARDEANGQPLIAGIPPLRIVREHRLGGMVDLWGDGNDGRPCFCGPSKDPVIWYASEAQAPIILHADDDPLWTLIQGSEGSGKTYTLAMWSALRVMEHVGHDREIGLTAPITRRMEHVRKAIRKLWPSHWYSLHETKGEYRFRAGPVVILASAHTSRKDEGSPIQGANWVAHGGDELQDHFDKEPDIQARGRAAPDGRYKRLNTSTSKDSTEWRTFRGIVESSTAWRFVRVLGMDNPLIPPSHWTNLKAGGQYTPREWNRRVLAMDVGPERQVYHCWSRRLDDGTPGNLRPIPVGAMDVTAEVLAPYGDHVGMLIGHDPGTRQHVSEFLKAYRMPSDVRRGDLRPRWFVVDEVTTPDATVHAHAVDVLKRSREKWHCNQLDYKGRPDPESLRVLVRIDPHTRTGDTHPGQDVYSVWRSLGMTAKAAAYKPGSVEPQTIKKLSRIDMINTLLLAVSADEHPVRRLFVACDDRGTPVAPRLVGALESMEYNEANKAEAEEKGINDQSHWPCALGYALWQVEHHRVGKVAA